ESWTCSVRRTIGMFLVVVGWVVFHPTLIARLTGAAPIVAEARERMPVPVLAARTVLAQLNLDRVPRPGDAWSYVLITGALGAIILAGLVFFAMTRMRQVRETRAPSPRDAILV